MTMTDDNNNLHDHHHQHNQKQTSSSLPLLSQSPSYKSSKRLSSPSCSAVIDRSSSFLETIDFSSSSSLSTSSTANVTSSCLSALVQQQQQLNQSSNSDQLMMNDEEDDETDDELLQPKRRKLSNTSLSANGLSASTTTDNDDQPGSSCSTLSTKTSASQFNRTGSHNLSSLPSAAMTTSSSSSNSSSDKTKAIISSLSSTTASFSSLTFVSPASGSKASIIPASTSSSSAASYHNHPNHSNLHHSSLSSLSSSSSTSSKLSKKSQRQTLRLSSPTSHGRCLYFPGAYSYGKLSKCALYHCCHCQHPLSRYSRISQNHDLAQNGIGNGSSMPPPAISDRSSSFYGNDSAISASSNNSSSVKLSLSRPIKNPESLLEIASRLVAEHIPYEYIEQRYSCIPEPVQRRILFWSFPRDESYIRLYSSISSIFKEESHSYHLTITSTQQQQQHQQSQAPLVPPPPPAPSVPGAPASGSLAAQISLSSTDLTNRSQSPNSNTLFNNGLFLMLSRSVHQVLQVGFNLSGVVSNVTPLNSIASGSCPFYSTAVPTSHSSSAAAAAAAADLGLPIDNSSSGYVTSDYNRSSNGGGINSTAGSLYSRETSLYNRKTSYLVSITFDRCKITSVTCTCNSREYHLFWCEHVVALALYRIRKPFAVELRIPISDTLLEFDRDQLQKLVQYLIAEHHVQILPTVQRLADELSHKRASINLIAGAPDPTAGACIFGRHDWYLNEEKIRAQVRDLVKYVGITESKQIILLFYKVVEMLKIKDSNGPRFLRIITQQFLYSYSHYLKPEELSQRFDPFIFLWDHLTNLWIYIVADPNMAPLKRIEWREMFRHWVEHANCPREDTYFSLEVDTGADSRYSDYPQNGYIKDKYDDNFDNLSDDDYIRRMHINHIRRRRILERAFDATYLQWDDSNLQLILSHDGPANRNSFIYFSEHFDLDGFPIWSEHLPTACVRIASLRVNGYKQEALRLAMAVVRYLKHLQYQRQQQHKHKLFCDFEVAPSSESWIGNPVDPIGILFDTLAEASLAPDSKSINSCYALVGYDRKIDIGHNKNVLVDLFIMYNEVNERTTPPFADSSPELSDTPIYRHVPVIGSVSPTDTYLCAAMTVALIGLAQHRRAPDLESQRDKSYRQEERILRKLLDIKLDSLLIDVLREQASLLLKIGLLSDLVSVDHLTKNVPCDIAQIPGFARYLFGAILPTDPNMAYEIGLRSLKFFILKDERTNDSNIDERHDRHDRLRKLRSNLFFYLDVQLILAKTMLFAARNDSKRLELIFHTIQRYVNNPHYLNKLSQDIFQFSRNEFNGTRHEPLLRIAYAFGLHLTKITRNDLDLHRKVTVQWLVTCASEIGFDSILHLMNSWQEYFTPLEAVRLVAATVLSPGFNTQITQTNFSKLLRHDELASSARKLAVECALQDPANCALNALSLCEKDQLAFDTISQVVEKAGTVGHMSALQLFTVARYMEHHGVSDRACKIALLAADRVFIPLNADTHHAIGDLQWACSLAQILGHNELNQLVNILVKNVHCAPVLADMIRRCTQPIPSKHMIHMSGMRPNFVQEPTTMAYIDLSVEERMRRRQFKTYPLDRPPLSTLLNAAVQAYIETVMARLEHISPRHYSDFIEFLTRAQETIVLTPGGKKDFATLLKKIKSLYKGKKKLMFLVKERFG